MAGVSFLVPKTLAWDKLSALFLEVRARYPDVKLQELRPLIADGRVCVVFEDDAEVPDDAVDIDVRVKYSVARDAGSATERAARARDLLGIPGVARLVELVNAHNASGFLKNDAAGKTDLGSLPYLLRMAYDLERPPNRSEREHRLEVVADFWPAVDVYLRAAERDPQAVDAIRNPFTAEAFLRLEEIAGVAREEWSALEARLCEHYELACLREAGAQEAAGRTGGTTFPLSARGEGTAEGHVIHTDDARVPAAYLRTHPACALLIVCDARGSPGHIFCRGRQSFARLSQALEERDPGWYLFEKKGISPQLHRGSSSRAGTPSRLSADEIVAIVRESYRHYVPKNR